MSKNKPVNFQMSLLSVIAISFVILGHINFPQIDPSAPGTLYGWFPYYSFHLPLFLFISGYFFKDTPKDSGFLRHFGKFLIRKIKSLIVPYYIINGIFLLAGTVLANYGITFLRPFRLVEWLTFPWTRLYTVTFSVPTWYMISLFIAEIYFLLLRHFVHKIIKNDLAGEIIVLAITLVLGVLTLYVAEAFSISQTVLVYLRSVLMLFFIQVGVLYRKYLEKRDTLGNVPYFLLLLLIQFLIIVLSGNASLSPGLYGVIGFGIAGYDYFLAGLTGLALWLRITRILSNGLKTSRFLIFVGNNTKYIMSFHVFGFFLLNSLFSFLRSNRIGMTFLGDFSPQIFHSYLYYVCNVNPRMVVLYFLAGMGFSLLIAWLIQALSKLLHKLHYSPSL